MTFSKDQVQALVAEIDGVLQKPTSRLPWVSGEAIQQRRVLERVRNYLVALQKNLPIAPERSMSRTDLLSYDISYQQAQSSSAQPANPQNAQQMLQTVMQEMTQLRSTLMQPLQADLSAMQQQRDELRREIQQLESQRRGSGTSQGNQQLTNEFLQVLMGRLQESLPQQVAQSLRGAGGAALTAAPGLTYESVEQLRSPQAQSDQQILNLDSTLRVVFEALQRDVTAYQESLAQGLDRMHSLGQQSEMMFNALITHLAQQLGREASTYLQASGQLPDAQLPDSQRAAAPNYPSLPPQPPAPPPTPSRLPFPGAELSPPTSASESSSVDRAIDSWLQSMGSSSSVSGGVQPSASQGTAGSPEPQASEALLDLNAAGMTAPSPSASGDSPRSLSEDPTDIDAALRLLQQLSANLESAAASPAAAAPAPMTNTLDGLDEFYELFDGDLNPPAPAIDPMQFASPSTAAISPLEAATGSMTGEAAGFGGLEASGNFDPTDGWDLLDNQPPQLPPVVVDRPIAPTPIDPADQIHSLDDLFEDLPSLDASPVAAPAVSPPVTKPPAAPTTPVATPADDRDQLFVTDDDRYISAAPEENLLPSQEQREAPHQEFWLDDLTLNRLSQDLSSLESTDAATLPPDRPGATDEFDMTFTEPEPQPPASQADSFNSTVGSTVAQTTPLPETAPIFEPEAIPASEVGGSTVQQQVSEPAAPPATSNPSLAFSLDDLDDLFETEAPSAPPISPVPASVSDSFGFTLEGMDDLFADLPAPTTTPIPPPDSSPLTIDEPLGFTLEGMDDLFADLPSPKTASPSEAASEKKTESP